MKLHVSHLTRYEYSGRVTFSPHLLYLRPRDSAHVRVESFGFNISPSAKVVWHRDSQDVMAAWAYFWDGAMALGIRSEFVVETLDANPFDFILRSQAVPFPFDYEPEDVRLLAPYRGSEAEGTADALRGWLQARLPDPPRESVPFLTALNRVVHQGLTYERRESGGIQAPAETVQRGRGACRDYAALFVALCRIHGLAARFVSGYHYAPPEEDTRSGGAMHAWAEVYLPGAGWKGLDPTHGIFCDESFIPVAHAAEAASATPIQGRIFSSLPVTARLHADVRVEKLT